MYVGKSLEQMAEIFGDEVDAVFTEDEKSVENDKTGVEHLQSA